MLSDVRKRRSRSPIPGIVIGIVGLAFAGWMFVHAKSDLQAYAGDPSCAFFDPNAASAGQCRAEAVRIDRVYRTTGKNARRYAVLDRPDGSQLTVAFGIIAGAAGSFSALVEFWRLR